MIAIERANAHFILSTCGDRTGSESNLYLGKFTPSLIKLVAFSQDGSCAYQGFIDPFAVGIYSRNALEIGQRFIQRRRIRTGQVDLTHVIVSRGRRIRGRIAFLDLSEELERLIRLPLFEGKKSQLEQCIICIGALRKRFYNKTQILERLRNLLILQENEGAFIVSFCRVLSRQEDRGKNYKNCGKEARA